MIEWDAARIAAIVDAELVADAEPIAHAELVAGAGPIADAELVADAGGGVEQTAGRGPARASIDSRAVQAGDLFFGLAGEREDGGVYAAQALRAGAWGVLVTPEHVRSASVAEVPGAILAHPDPLAALQTLAGAWRRELGAHVVAITGSTGKTSTKDILAALLSRHLRTAASPQNLNTEIGLPLAVLAAAPGTQALVLEMAMRGAGQIAQLTEIAQPDVGVIVNIGPVHLELLGSLQGVAAAKAELIAGLHPGATIVLPAEERLLDSHRRKDLHTVTFGEDGDVRLLGRAQSGEVTIAAGADRLTLKPSFAQSHNLRNLLAAVAAARALGVTPEGDLDVAFSALRGERRTLDREIVLIDDCYNANPMSMRAALEDLAASSPARRVAVLGDMLELGPDAVAYHREVGALAQRCGVELLIAVGPLAAEMREGYLGELHALDDARAVAELLPLLLRPRDTILVKGSRGVGLELVAQSLADASSSPASSADASSSTASSANTSSSPASSSTASSADASSSTASAQSASPWTRS